MLLAIDVGNTNTVFALHDGAKFIGEWRCNTESVRTADQYFVWLRQLMQHNGLGTFLIDSVVISNTAPATLFNLRVLCDRYFGCRPLVVGREGCRLPCEIRVDNPAEVGPDRLVNTIAAFDRYGGELIVVDFGTATTFDVISAAGEYIGGVICPGIGISADALFQRAARLPRVDVRKPPSIIGQTTVTSMQAGLFFGYVSMVDGIVQRIRAELPDGDRATCIATGGMATVLANETAVIERVEPDLTLQGLRLIWGRAGH
jgi:type III pantothenate kinase